MPGGAGGAPYGGPPAMPGGSNDRRDPSMFGRGGVVGPGGARGGVDDAEKKVLVDLGLEFDPQKAEAESKALRADLEKATANYEREVADGKRIRAEAASLRERIEELKAAVKDREEQAAAHDRVADELRDELQQMRNEMAKLRQEMGEMAENVATRERQAARAQEDSHKIREDMEDLNRQLMELSRTKDEGWKKLNQQLTEIEHLREVINEQERMLEERRVGLISQEEVIKELRENKERMLKQIAGLKAERDEAATSASRTAAQIMAIEEENRRLGRLLIENQGGSSNSSQSDHMMRLTSDIKDLRVEIKKLEADRDRVTEQYELAERDREKLEGKLAQVEVELQEAVHAKLAADSARQVAQEALAKAEVARHKAAEEALDAAQARDKTATASDDARRELDRLRKKVADLELVAKAGPAGAGVDQAELQREREANDRKLKDAIARAEQAERAQKALEASVEAAKTDAQKARAEAARAKASADAQAEAVIEAVGTPAGSPELAARAKEIYDAINDILSEMRNNMVLVQGELPNLKADGETMQAVTDAVEALVDSAETAKGALRGLRDLAEAK
jgi:chromosome segregation ATPase